MAKRTAWIFVLLALSCIAITLALTHQSWGYRRTALTRFEPLPTGEPEYWIELERHWYALPGDKQIRVPLEADEYERIRRHTKFTGSRTSETPGEHRTRWDFFPE